MFSKQNTRTDSGSLRNKIAKIGVHLQELADACGKSLMLFFPENSDITGWFREAAGSPNHGKSSEMRSNYVLKVQ